MTRWTDEQLADMRAAWEGGERSSAIAATFGVNRNVIIGIAHRRGWKHGWSARPAVYASGATPARAKVERRAPSRVVAGGSAPPLTPPRGKSGVPDLPIPMPKSATADFGCEGGEAAGGEAGRRARMPDEEFIRRWNDGESSASLAALCGVTYWAINARGRRLGLKGRPAGTPAGWKPKTAKEREPRERAAPGPWIPRAPCAEDIERQGRAAREGRAGATGAILALRHGDCKWPIGDPREADFAFCMEATAEGAVYCGAHAPLARGFSA